MNRIVVRVECQNPLAVTAKQMDGDMTFGLVFKKTTSVDVKLETFLMGGGISKNDLMTGIAKGICELIGRIESNPVEQLMLLDNVTEVIEEKQKQLASNSKDQLYEEFMKIFK